MFVVLDSSIIRQDLRFSTNPSRVLLGNHRVIPVTLVVPDVVIDEVTNLFREEFITAVTALREAHKKTKWLAPGTPDLGELPLVEPETVKYREFLLKQISDAGGRTLPYPQIPHQTIVKRELQRRKPFKKDGSGYRDLLIWESLCQLTWSGHERIAFITANVRDFISDAWLHEDLATDILNPGRVEVFASLKHFNEKHLIPRLEIDDRFNKELQTISSSNANVSAWIRDNLLEILRWDELGYAISPVPDAGSFYAAEIVSFDDFRATSARKLDDGGRLCSVVVYASVDVSIDIDEEDYRTHEEIRDWLGGPSIGSWHEIFPLAVSLELIIDPTGSRVSSHEVTGVEVAENGRRIEVPNKAVAADA